MSVQKELSDRKAFERFKEEHPELRSTQNIANLAEAQFVQDYASSFESTQQAKRIHKTAVDIQQRTALIWSNLKDIASPFLQNTRFNNIPHTFLDYQQSIPGYDRLFGNLDYIDCDPCRSVFGAAAYFVDLMRFVEENITNQNSIPTECQLEQRRPDLFNLKLDCNNTNDLVPYIELIIEILETIVTDADNSDADRIIERASFPANLPYNVPLAEIRSYLRQLKISLHEIYGLFEIDLSTKELDIAREVLELSPSESNLVQSDLTTPEELSNHYGLDVTLKGDSGLENVAVFLQKTELNRQELNDLVYQDLDRHEVNAGLSRLFFINNVNDGLGPLSIEQGESDTTNFYQVPQETLVNLSLAKLDRIYRFVKLARKLGWSFADLDWALRSLQQPYIPERTLQFDGINDYVSVENATNLNLNTVTIEAWINPSRTHINPILSKGQANNPLSIHFMVWIDAENKLALRGNSITETNYPHSSQSIPVGVRQLQDNCDKICSATGQ